MKEEFMEMQEDMLTTETGEHLLREHIYIQQQMKMQEQEQLITNQNNLKMKKVSNVKDAVEVKETKKETLRRLFC